MPSSTSPFTLARAANLNRSWVTKAIQLGLVNESALDGEDLIAVKTLSIVDRIVWPGDRQSRSESRSTPVWQTLAVNAAREAANDPRTTSDTVLWVTQREVYVAITAGENAAFVIDRLKGQCAYSIPVGVWIEELPAGFALHRKPTRSSQAAVQGGHVA